MAKPAAGTPAGKNSTDQRRRRAGNTEAAENHEISSWHKWDYSNSGYAVLAMVVQKVSGQPFGDFLHDRIFAPLKMNADHGLRKRKEYRLPPRLRPYPREAAPGSELDQSSTSAVLGDGGVYSSLDDLAKWDQALAQSRLLSEAEMKPAITPVKISDGSVQEPDGTPAAYGFGWFLNSYKGHRANVALRRNRWLSHHHSALRGRQAHHHHPLQSRRPWFRRIWP